MAKKTGDDADLARANAQDPTPWVMIVTAIAIAAAIAAGVVVYLR